VGLVRVHACRKAQFSASDFSERRSFAWRCKRLITTIDARDLPTLSYSIIFAQRRQSMCPGRECSGIAWRSQPGTPE
jgi:hypothetical protein